MKNTGKKGAFFELKDFLVLWSSQAVSTLGTAITNFALIIWVYEQKGTASSITMLSIVSFLPSILFCFIAGTIADRWDKKRIMLLADFLAAIGTLCVLILYLASALEIWHLYIVNFILSFMNAFQNPASYVATSLLVPKKHYIRVSGLQSLSGSLIMILAPALGSALFAFGGLRMVLILDLLTFAIAFSILLLFVKLHKIARKADEVKEGFLKNSTEAIRFLKNNKAMLKIILFFAFINLMSKMGSYGMLPAFVLGRTDNNRYALGMVEMAVGIGTLAGSIMVTAMKPARNKIKVIFISCGISFLLGDILQSLSVSLPLWFFSALAANIPLAFLNANLTAIMRYEIPIEMQGRVFSARDTLQYSTIPLGLFLGGFLADNVFEPFMSNTNNMPRVLNLIFGSGRGAGLALMFFLVGIIGAVTSFLSLRNPLYKNLNKE